MVGRYRFMDTLQERARETELKNRLKLEKKVKIVGETREPQKV